MKDNEGLRFLCSKAEVIDEIETVVPQWVKNRNPEWYPAYIHVLKVASLSKVMPSWMSFAEQHEYAMVDLMSGAMRHPCVRKYIMPAYRHVCSCKIMRNGCFTIIWGMAIFE